MEAVCPIDSRCAHEISVLLSDPSPRQVQDYFDELLSTRQCQGITVKQDADLGKGVYATKDLKEGELVLKDQMFVGAQHSSNKIDCFVCSCCFRFIGSIELQIGRRLYLQELGASEGHGCDMESYSDSTDGEDNSHGKMENAGECGSGSSKVKIRLPDGVVESLMNGQLMLPYSKEFSLTPAVPCPGGCGEAYYCSTSCADADWESSHSLLCTGERSDPERREALLKFSKHANETNDIFLLAAKAISSTILKYHKLKASRIEKRGKCDKACVSNSGDLSLLLEAWRPISMAHKRRWWDCIALPDDVDSSDEAAFRMQIKELASKSLQLLKTAIFDKECESLFSLEIYGHIIGMFELNNLDLVVASPVEDYFLYIDNLTYPEKVEAEKITQPILDALGEDYSICCQAIELCISGSSCISPLACTLMSS